MVLRIFQNVVAEEILEHGQIVDVRYEKQIPQYVINAQIQNILIYLNHFVVHVKNLVINIQNVRYV